MVQNLKPSLFLWLWLAFFLCPRSSEAQTTEMDRARAAYALGQQLYDASDFELARQAFLESLAAFPHFKTLFNIGLCEEKLGNVQQAIDMYTRYVDWPTEVPHREEVVAKLAELKALLPLTVAPAPEESTPSPPLSESSIESDSPGPAARPALRAAGWGSLILGGASVLTGAALLVAAATKAHRIEDINAKPGSYEPGDHAELAQQGRKIETAGWIVGGVGLAATTLGIVLIRVAQGEKRSDAPASVGFVPGAGGATAVALWRF